MVRPLIRQLISANRWIIGIFRWTGSAYAERVRVSAGNVIGSTIPGHMLDIASTNTSMRLNSTAHQHLLLQVVLDSLQELNLVILLIMTLDTFIMIIVLIQCSLQLMDQMKDFV